MGAPLSRRPLATELGMSFIPITEALQRLRRDGLVESKPRSGTRVKIPSAEEILGQYVVREALETQAARLFAEFAGEREKRELANRAKQVDALFASPPAAKMDRAHRLFEIHKVHFLFHMRIAELAGCKELTEAIERNQVLIFHWLYNSAAHFDTLPAHWHQDLTEALSSGDPEKADRMMRRHVRFRREAVAERIAAYLPGNEATATFRGPRTAEPKERPE